MSSSFFLKIFFLIAMLVIVGSLARTKPPQPIILNISTKDLIIEPVVATNDQQPIIKVSKPVATVKPEHRDRSVILSTPPASGEESQSKVSSSPQAPQNDASKLASPTPTLPPFTEKELDKILFAVPRIRCGSLYGSGMIIKIDDKRYALTAAHLVANRIAAGQTTCDIIFPRKDDFGVFKEAFYRTGKILLPEQTKTQYQTKAYDIAILEVLPLPSEDPTVFPDGQPFINHTFCPANTLYDNTLLVGYPVNAGTTATPGGVISKFPGIVAQFSDIDGVEARSESGGFTYYPILKNNKDVSGFHPITITASVNNFAGASGGLVFDMDKRCVLGINTATGVVDNTVYGVSINPAFKPIVDFLESAVNQ